MLHQRSKGETESSATIAVGLLAIYIEVTLKNHLTKIKIPDIINTVKLNNSVNQWVEI